jgi:hypothetical protein
MLGGKLASRDGWIAWIITRVEWTNFLGTYLQCHWSDMSEISVGHGIHVGINPLSHQTTEQKHEQKHNEPPYEVVNRRWSQIVYNWFLWDSVCVRRVGQSVFTPHSRAVM